MDVNFQVKFYPTTATYKIPHPLWRKETDSLDSLCLFFFFSFSFVCHLLVADNLGGDKTIMDLSDTDYIC